MARLSAVGLFVCLVVVASAVATGAVAPPVGDGEPRAGDRAGAATVDGAAAPSQSAASSRPPAVQAQEFDRTVFTIEVYPNGSARWRFSYRRGLANETERQRFEEFADSFRENETDTYREFKGRAERLTGAGTNETGREMNATGFQRDAYVNRLGNQGIVEMSFTWTNFSERTDGQIIVGDVFEGGLYVGPNQQLIVTWDGNLRPTAVDPEPAQNDSGSLVWVGGENGRQFLDGRPRVVFVPEGTDGGGAGDGGAGTDGTVTASPDGAASEGGPPLWPLAVLLAALLVGGAVAYRRGALGDGADGSGPPRDDSGGGTTPPTDGGESAASPVVSDAELMTDEDRVLALLSESGGRMKQVDIVEETGWSKSKVSMLLSEMDEEGQISKLRVGRENIISRAGDEPDAAGSPFDDE